MFDFNLPILDRPILWYGFLFAFGFLLGYCILIYLLHRYFLLNYQFRKEDVASWIGLIQLIAKQKTEMTRGMFEKISSPYQKICHEWRVGDEISGNLQEEIIGAMNQVLMDREIIIKQALSSLSKRLLKFAKPRVSEVTLAILHRRLQMEQELNCVLFFLKKRTARLAEQLSFYVILGAIIGARIVDVLFYQDVTSLKDWISVVAVWQGGLASHGGAAGILIALWIFSKRSKIPFWTTVDFTVIPTALAAVCIRVGNFINQEILGKATTLPWGVVFLHPADRGPIVARHPAQLYEAFWYLCVFVILMLYWHRHFRFEPRGRTTGLFLILVFTFRFFIEFLKEEQSVWHSSLAFLTMGQWLSLPFMAMGIYLYRGSRKA